MHKQSISSSQVPVWTTTGLLHGLQQPSLYAATVKLYISPQSRPVIWQENDEELHVFNSPPDDLMAVAVYSSTSGFRSQDMAAVFVPHSRLTYTGGGLQGPRKGSKRLQQHCGETT